MAEPTKFLDKVVFAAKEAAHEKYADIPDFLGHVFSSHQLPQNAPFHHHVGEGLRQMAFGDPLTVHNEFRQGGLGHVLSKTLRPQGLLDAGMRYGLPAALTANMYRKLSPEQRSNSGGAILGNAAGGLLGGHVGGRFGMLGQSVLAPLGARAGQWLGSKFDKPAPQQQQPPVHQVNVPPT
jgi:hypothetical protein